MAHTRKEYAKLLVSQKKFSKALPLAQEALEIHQDLYRPDHPEIVKIYPLLIEIHTALGQDKEAEAYRKLAESHGKADN